MNSQCASILKWLRDGKPITPLLALQQFGCMRLAARIGNLKASGHLIDTTMITVTNADGSQSRVAEYRLSGVSA